MELTARRKLQVLTEFPSAYVLALIALVGVAAWGFYVWVGQQLITGLGVTGMNAPTYWGAYIVNFVFFVGLSAGGIIVSALVHALRIERYRAVARIAEVLAIISILLAGIFISLDIGRPDRLWHLVRYGRWQSPLIWDLIIMAAYLAMALALGYFSTREDIVRCMRAIPSRAGFYRLLALGYVDVSPAALRRDQLILRVVAFASIPGAVLLHSITAWIMGLAKATPGWHTSLLAPLFVGSALVSGLALVIVAADLSRRLFKAEVPEETTAQLGRLLTVLVPVLGYFLFSELLTVVYAQEVSPSAFFEEIVTGDYALFFWFDLLVGLVAPLLILAYVWWAPRLAGAEAEAPRPALVPERAVLARGLGLTIAAAAAALVIVSFFVFANRPTAAGLEAEQLSPSGTGLAIGLNALAAAGLVFLATRLRAAAAVGLAGFLVVAGVLAERVNIVLAPQFTRFSAQPEETFALPYVVPSYAPTWQEMSIVAGVYALGLLGFVAFAKVFPLVELEEEEERAAPERERWGLEPEAEREAG